jgi:proline iminopeptidase
MLAVVRVESRGSSLAARDHGGAGEPVILLHGGPGVPDYLEPVAAMLTPKYRTVTFDQRGVGASMAKDGRYGLTDYVEDVDAVREHFGFGSVHLFGHSWGGLLAQLYLADHPDRVRSLFLSSSSPGVGTQWKTTEREVLGFNRRRSGPLGFAAMGLWQLVMTIPGSLGDAGTRRLMARVWRNYFPDPRTAPPPDEAWLRGLRSMPMRATTKSLRGADSDPLARLRGVSIPMLVLFGSDDIYETAADVLRERFPNARHVIIQDSGHMPWLQAPVRFREVMSEFYAAAT